MFSFCVGCCKGNVFTSAYQNIRTYNFFLFCTLSLRLILFLNCSLSKTLYFSMRRSWPGSTLATGRPEESGAHNLLCEKAALFDDCSLEEHLVHKNMEFNM